MNIESFEPYHIGIKVSPTLTIPALRKQLLPKLKASGFESVVDEKLASNVIPQVEVIANIGETRIELNYTLSALNTVGTKPEETTDVFKKILEIIKELKYEIQGFALSIDIVTNVTIRTDNDPTELINKSVKCNLAPWKELNENTKANGIKIDLVDEEYGKETLRLLVGPSSLSPKTAAIVSIRYLHIEAEPIINFGYKLEERIMKFMQSLGGE